MLPAKRLWPHQLLILVLGGKCAKCGSLDKLQTDHITELYNGGTNDPSNLQVLCRTCHTEKTKRARHMVQINKVRWKNEFTITLPYFAVCDMNLKEGDELDIDVEVIDGEKCLTFYKVGALGEEQLYMIGRKVEQHAIQ